MTSRTRSCNRSFKRFSDGCFAACLIVASGLSLPASGEPPAASPAADAPAAIDFERQIRPLLVGRCGDCHGPDTQESHLRLDVKHRALKGGDFGPVILPGKSDESELVRRVRSTKPKTMMPPDGDRLSPSDIALLEAWIAIINNPDKVQGKIFTIGPNNPIKIRDYAHLIARKIGWEGEIRWDMKPKRQGEIYWLNSNHNLITATLGWEPTTSLSDGLDATIAVWREKLDRRV
jgi:nucleoside-diphosphate-sugar epimerase